MKDKLRAYLKDSKGFTLVELLIVIAIIAILVLIVIVAINPLQRIHDATDQQASSDVRSVASAVEGCIARNDGIEANCNDVAELTLAEGAGGAVGGVWIRNFPASVIISGAVTLCAPGGNGHSWTWTTATGTVAEDDPAAC